MEFECEVEKENVVRNLLSLLCVKGLQLIQPTRVLFVLLKSRWLGAAGARW